MSRAKDSGLMTSTASSRAEDRRVSPVTSGNRLKRAAWSMVQATLYRHSFHTWSGWRRGLLRAFGASIGRGCTLRKSSRVYYPWNLVMGELSCLGDDAEVYNLGKVTIGARATISQGAYLCAGTHDYRKRNMPLVTLPIDIGADAWVCAKAFIGPGLVVGQGAVVAAGSVVVKDVKEWTIVGGNPARYIKNREYEDLPERHSLVPDVVTGKGGGSPDVS